MAAKAKRIEDAEYEAPSIPHLRDEPHYEGLRELARRRAEYREEAPEPERRSYLRPESKPYVDAYWQSQRRAVAGENESEPGRAWISRPQDSRAQSSFEELEQSEEASGSRPRTLRRTRLDRSEATARMVRDVSIAVGLMAGLGGLAAVVVYDRSNSGVIAEAVVAPFAPAQASASKDPTRIAAEPSETSSVQPPPAAEGATSPIKPIITARLDVADAAGTARSMIPLSLAVDTSGTGQDLALRVSGLPDSAYLTAGIRLAGNAWLLKPREANNVKLVVPDAKQGPLELTVAAIEAKTGELAAPVKDMAVRIAPAVDPVIEPASAAPERHQNFGPAQTVELAALPEPAGLQQTPPAAAKIPADAEGQVKGLVWRGDQLLSMGDFAAAREYYAQALKLGAAPNTLMQLAMTYDPVVYAAQKVFGLDPDANAALAYYRKADAAGVAGARDAIARLEAWTKK